MVTPAAVPFLLSRRSNSKHGKRQMRYKCLRQTTREHETSLSITTTCKPPTQCPMVTPLNRGYKEMLRAPGPSVPYTRTCLSLQIWFYSLSSPRRTAIDGLQKRIDLHFEEINKLRSAQNSYAPVFGLPAELLSEGFLYTVESGLKDGGVGFTRGTFGFLQVCKRWNEVAVAFPQLWVWWASGAFKAWDPFNARSKGAPISPMWGFWCTKHSPETTPWRTLRSRPGSVHLTSAGLTINWKTS